MVEAGNKSDLDRVRIDRKNNRDARTRGLGSERRWTAQGGYQIDAAIDQLGGEGWQARVFALSRAIFDREVLVSGEAFELQAFVKGGKFQCRCLRTIEDPKDRQGGLLGVRMARQHRRCTCGEANSSCYLRRDCDHLPLVITNKRANLAGASDDDSRR